MFLILVLYNYYKDVKEIGKNNLALNLKQRLISYFICFPLPIIFGIILRWL